MSLICGADCGSQIRRNSRETTENTGRYADYGRGKEHHGYVTLNGKRKDDSRNLSIDV
ncbi:hypothetical protein PN4B1_33020 [Paenibacillus naphthalenovorans]|nr:hypothetical protein PN4B1_33020 [Paenibacillus naphthalenovorans]